MAYKLNLTEKEFGTILFCGTRYGWSSALLAHCDVGDNVISEPVAWKLQAAFDSDAAGGHAMLPFLAPSSSLSDKLLAFYDSIV